MDKIVIIILIGCATLIALTAIGCDFWVEKKTAETPERLWPNKTIKIHRNYIAGFLGFGIIMLLTAQYGGTCEDLLTYLSFGSTLTSLVLSVLAIFVTVRSSFDLYKQYGTIKQVSEQIGESLRNLKTSETKIGEVSSDISTQMERIVDEIEKRLDVRLKKTENTFSEQIQKQYVNTQSIQSDVNTNINYDTSTFLKGIPYQGLLALYACAKGIELKKKFVLYDLFNDNELYYVGVLVTVVAAGYLDAKINVENNHYVVKVNKSILKLSDIYNAIKENKYYKSHTTEGEIEINQIKDFFSD